MCRRRNRRDRRRRPGAICPSEWSEWRHSLKRFAPPAIRFSWRASTRAATTREPKHATSLLNTPHFLSLHVRHRPTQPAIGTPFAHSADACWSRRQAHDPPYADIGIAWRRCLWCDGSGPFSLW
jgi:hypothetical protein